MHEMKKEIQTRFKCAIDKLYQNDFSLIQRKCSERSIVFRLGLYLSHEFENLGCNVDCEYNKNGVHPKSLNGRRFNFPDIVVHDREHNTRNLLIIEVKTSNDTSPKHFKNDKEKLVGFTSEYPYKYDQGIHVYISATKCRIVWYANGKIYRYEAYKISKNEHILQCEELNSKNMRAFDRWYKCFDIPESIQVNE